MNTSKPTLIAAAARASNGAEGQSVWLTYGELLEFLQKLSPSELNQPVQMFESGSGDTVALYGVFAVNTVDYWSRAVETGEVIEKFRSVLDNEHHPEHIVMLMDGCPFSEEGDTLYTLQDDNTWVGNKSGKIIDF